MMAMRAMTTISVMMSTMTIKMKMPVILIVKIMVVMTENRFDCGHEHINLGCPKVMSTDCNSSFYVDTNA
jgi:hypothetical protein